jgi:TusA-related sulfurtransferase
MTMIIYINGKAKKLRSASDAAIWKEMKQGQILAVILDDREPIRNVPRAVREEGNQILNVDKIGSEWRLLIKKI